VFGDGSAARDFVYIDDVVDAFARAGTGGDGMVLNVGTGQATSLAELHRLMVEVAGAVIGSEPDSSGERGPALGLRHADRPVGEAHAVVLDPARAAQALGWSAWTSLPSGLDAVVRSARDTARRA
jgi:UDP-glucose 4-epimerase